MFGLGHIRAGRVGAKAKSDPFPFTGNLSFFCFLSRLLRISRLFSDAKKILLYSQNDKNLDGFKELSQALQLLQDSRSGRRSVPLTC